MGNSLVSVIEIHGNIADLLVGCPLGLPPAMVMNLLDGF